MDAIDKIYTKYPFYGSRRIRYALQDDYRIYIGREHVQRLMRDMGIEAIYPKRKTSISDKEHLKYPYLLKNLNIIRPNQVWGTDITYVRLEKGWAYLTAIMDWFSRYALSWKLSPTMETDFCMEALEEALITAMPEIHNSDQGSQFTSENYLNILKDNQIKISMDGKGRCMDNIFTERLWRTVKYENIYIKSYGGIPEAKEGLKEYFSFYNQKRRHQSLDYQTPEKIYNKITPFDN